MADLSTINEMCKNANIRFKGGCAFHDLSHNQQRALQKYILSYPFDWNRFIDAYRSFTFSSDSKPIYKPYINKINRRIEPAIPQCTIAETSLGMQQRQKKHSSIGFVILAGGQATRLNIPPTMAKAVLKVSPCLQKSLLQIFFEKALAYEKVTATKVYIAIFTSETTQHSIQQELKNNANFGVAAERLSIIKQSSLPFFTQQGELLFDPCHDTILKGPDGNGSILYTLEHERVLEYWQQSGIEIFSVALIDNPLLDPFLDELIDCTTRQNECVTTPIFDIAFTAVAKLDDNEKVGLFAYEEKTQNVTVVEYSELQDVAFSSSSYVLSDFMWANTSQCMIRMDWARKSAASTSLPWHLAYKQSSCSIAYYKLEQFIFDVLAHTKKACFVALPRSHYFAPIKNKEGQDSLKTAQKALIQRDKYLLHSIIVDKEAKKLVKKLAEQPKIELDAFWLYTNKLQSITAAEFEKCIGLNYYIYPYQMNISFNETESL